MSELVKTKPPKLADLIDESNLPRAYKEDSLNYLLNQQPPQEWVKEHPYIKGHLYLPIDKVEYLLKKIFGRHRIEITGRGTAFNGVWVTVRVHYFNMYTTNEWDFHDGIGAIQLQTKSGSTPAQMENINNGALSMAFPHAETLAIKDACDNFGDLFGANLNRKDTLNYKMDENLSDKVEERIEVALSKCKSMDDFMEVLEDTPEKYVHLVKQAVKDFEAEEHAEN